jgi:hypothetical protein
MCDASNRRIHDVGRPPTKTSEMGGSANDAAAVGGFEGVDRAPTEA